MNDINIPTEVQYSEYKGNKIIVLPNGQKNGFSFGLAKAKLIVKYFEEIKLFIKENTNENQK